MKNKRHIKSFNESTENLNISDISGSYDNDWNDALNKVEEGLKNQPIHYKDSHNLRGEVSLKNLRENYGIDFEDGLDELVDLVAYLIRKVDIKSLRNNYH